MSNKPHIIHIGFSKCASTYLRYAIKSTHGLSLLFKTEYFTPSWFKDKPSTQKYFEMIATARAKGLVIESDEHIVLPNTHPELGIRVSNLNEVQKIIDEIAKTHNSVKIILIIRNQEDLLMSRYCEYVYNGGVTNMVEFFQLMLKKDNNKYFQNYYSILIQMLYEIFDEKNVLVLLQEEFNKPFIASQLEKFIESPIPLNFIKNIHSQRRSISKYGIIILLKINQVVVRGIRSYKEKPTTVIPYDLYRSCVKIIRYVDYIFQRLSKKRHKLKFPPEISTQIQRSFKDDNKRLSEILGKDLKAFRYY